MTEPTSSCSAARSATASGCCSRACTSSARRATPSSPAPCSTRRTCTASSNGSRSSASSWSPSTRCPKGTRMSAPHPDTIVLIHGFWVTPRSWEHWIAHYEAKGFTVLAPAYPGFEVEVEALNADPTPIEALTVPQIIEHLEARRRRARHAADPHGPLGRRRVHPDPARPRLRRRRRGDQLGADRGRQASCRSRRSRRPSRCSRTRPTATRPSASRTSSGTTRSPTASARRSRRALYERYHIPASGAIFWGSALANIHPGHDDTYVELQQRRPRAAAVHLRQRGPPDAAVDPAVQRQALQVGHDHRGQGVRGPAPAARRRTAGRRSPTTRSTGRSSTPRSASAA